MSLAKLNPAGCCSTFSVTTMKGLFLLKQMQMSVLAGLKKTAQFASRFFVQMGSHLAKGALFAKEVLKTGYQQMKSFAGHYPKELKIAALAFGAGIVLTALAAHLCRHPAPIQQAQTV